MRRVGVFICHCGTNIAATVDVAEAEEAISRYPGVVYACHYQYMCSEPGQKLMREAIEEHELDAVVVASCSPSLHETTFRRNVASAGINPYCCEIANIREQCSWVHSDKAVATTKAIEIVGSLIAKVRLDEPLESITVPVTRRALVLGGGIAGIQAALDIANGGHEVVLVEKDSSIGGRMAQLSETFPTLDCSQCILTPRMVEVSQHVKITLMTYTELVDVSGFVGNFTVRLRRKPAFVDWNRCTGCGMCSEKCPVSVPSEFDRGLGARAAIYTPFPQAVPNKPVIDSESCLHFTKGRCGACAKVCPAEAICYEQEAQETKLQVGALVLATGYDLFPLESIGEYGYGRYKDVIDGLTFERLLSASGPTGGEVRRPSDGRVPQKVVFVQCVGSRDEEKGFPYCSKICCMYTAKHATLYKHRVPEGQAYIFYIDIRAGGKGYEEFVQRTMAEEKALYLRGRVARIFEDDGRLMVWGADTLTGQKVEVEADLVVLAVAIMPRSLSGELARVCKVNTDSYGFLSEAHPKLRPVETLTAGVFLAGCGQAPRDIPDTVAQASGAASKVLALFSRERLEQLPIVATVDEELCSGCGLCVPACPYGAREVDMKRHIALVNEALCEGCGACVSVCPNGASQQKNFFTKQIMAMIEATL